MLTVSRLCPQQLKSDWMELLSTHKPTTPKPLIPKHLKGTQKLQPLPALAAPLAAFDLWTLMQFLLCANRFVVQQHDQSHVLMSTLSCSNHNHCCDNNVCAVATMAVYGRRATYWMNVRSFIQQVVLHMPKPQVRPIAHKCSQCD